MQKWEYCAVGPVAFAPEGPAGYDAVLAAFSAARLKSTDTDEIARTIARLGEEGWEMVGCGDIGPRPLSTGIMHYLYFKRPKQE
jgi:hypothetical protein